MFNISIVRAHIFKHDFAEKSCDYYNNIIHIELGYEFMINQFSL